MDYTDLFFPLLSKNTKDLIGCLFAITEDNNLLSVVNATFQDMAIAEQEIEKGTRKYPERQNEIFDAFRLMMPTEVFAPFRSNKQLYRIHCQNIIEKIVNGEDTREPTDAEILCVMALVSQPVVLKEGPAKLYLSLFDKYFPDVIATEEKVRLAHIDKWQAEAAMREIVRKLSQEWRK